MTGTETETNLTIDEPKILKDVFKQDQDICKKTEKNITELIKKENKEKLKVVQKSRKRKNRCKECGKKGLIVFDCKCGNKFCSSHLLPEVHECLEIEKFKEKAKKLNNEKLENDKVQGEKVEQI